MARRQDQEINSLQPLKRRVNPPIPEDDSAQSPASRFGFEIITKRAITGQAQMNFMTFILHGLCGNKQPVNLLFCNKTPDKT